VAGDDASAIVPATEGAGAAPDDDTAVTDRVDPMPPADPATTMTWNATAPGEDRPRE
jgi:hypothetical protein